ncbi:MAG: caspase family protein [Kofleriaceae bacterium]|nr:caspase family protein [Kofleriaceae bacterium]
MRCFLTSISVILVCLCVHSSTANAFQGTRRYALIIGNNIGRDSDAELRYAQKDALRFSAVMQRHGGLKAENTIVMLGNSAKAVKRALQEINARIRMENDRHSSKSSLIVYYSGHADADGLHPGSATLSYNELRTLLRGSAADLRLLILDGCRSGGLTKVKGGSPTKRFHINVKSNDSAQGLIMISSSAAGEDSHESTALKASFFSHHFINGLVGAADEDSSGTVTLREAYAYAYRNTLRTSGRGVQLQHPTYSYEIKGRDEVIMTVLSGAQRSGRLRLGEAGEYLIYRGSEGGEIVAEVNVLQKNALIAIPAGRYFVQLQKRDHYREFTVSVGRGEISTIDTSSGRRVAYARLVRKGSEHKNISHQVFSRAGVRGAILAGGKPSPTMVLGYQFDLPTVSIALRARFSQEERHQLSNTLYIMQRDWGLGVSAQHYIDYSPFSVGIGLVAEAVQFRQVFSGESKVPARNSMAFSFGALFSVEREISDRVVLSLEGGPVTYLVRKVRTLGGEELGSSSAGILTAWASLGLGVLF